MTKIYSVYVTAPGMTMPCIVFSATLAKARLRSVIHRAQGYGVSRPAYCPKMTRAMAAATARGQIIAPALRDWSL